MIIGAGIGIEAASHGPADLATTGTSRFACTRGRSIAGLARQNRRAPVVVFELTGGKGILLYADSCFTGRSYFRPSYLAGPSLARVPRSRTRAWLDAKGSQERSAETRRRSRPPDSETRQICEQGAFVGVSGLRFIGGRGPVGWAHGRGQGPHPYGGRWLSGARRGGRARAASRRPSTRGDARQDKAAIRSGSSPYSAATRCRVQTTRLQRSALRKSSPRGETAAERRNAAATRGGSE